MFYLVKNSGFFLINFRKISVIYVLLLSIREITWTKLPFSAWKFRRIPMENLEPHTGKIYEILQQVHEKSGQHWTKYFPAKIYQKFNEFSKRQSQPGI